MPGSFYLKRILSPAWLQVFKDYDFFLPAFFAAFLGAAFLEAALAGFATLAAAFESPPFAADLSPNTLSQFFQNFGFVPVRTIGPLIELSSSSIKKYLTHSRTHRRVLGPDK
jgi:hypothetical protein